MRNKDHTINRRRFLKSSASGVAGVGILANLENVLGDPTQTGADYKSFGIRGKFIIGFDGFQRDAGTASLRMILNTGP